MIKHGSFDQAAAGALIKICFADLAQQAQCGFVPRTDEPDFELEDQLALRDEVAVDLHEQLRLIKFSPRVRRPAIQHLPVSTPNWDQLTPDMRALIQEGVARAVLEQDRLYRFRTEDRFADYEPEDPLFRRKHTTVSFEAPVPHPAQPRADLG